MGQQNIEPACAALLAEACTGATGRQGTKNDELGSIASTFAFLCSLFIIHHCPVV